MDLLPLFLSNLGYLYNIINGILVILSLLDPKQPFHFIMFNLMLIIKFLLIHDVHVLLKNQLKLLMVF